MNVKRKEQLKRVWRGFLKGVLTKTAYCIYVEKKHKMEYRSTIMDTMSFTGPRPVHVNMCLNCKRVMFVNA